MRFTFSGKTQAEILPALTDMIRVCVHIGDDAASDLMQCTLKGDGVTLVCVSIE